MKLSVNDLIMHYGDATIEQTISHSATLALHLDELAYERVWYAEHHYSPIMLSCSPEVIIPYIASKTKRIKVGSGGIMLNHYSAFKVAELFTFLSHIFPGRIDLGVGRSTSGPLIDRALDRSSSENHHEDYECQINDLINWLHKGFPANHIFKDLSLKSNHPPQISILGSSVNSSEMAAKFSVPYVFADFFQPQVSKIAIDKYKNSFIPSPITGLTQSHTMIGYRFVAAEKIEELPRLLAPLYIMRDQLLRGTFNTLMDPDKAIRKYSNQISIEEEFSFGNGSPVIMIGTFEQISDRILKKTKFLGADEIILQDFVLDPKIRINGYKYFEKSLN
jgi:luciferase family oxidoreductase group 1